MQTTESTASAPTVDWASGSWTVTPGNEAAFVACWEEFLQWTKAEAAGFRSASLIHDRGTSGHYVSLASWDSLEDIHRWRELPGFAAHFRACRELCDDLYAGDYALAAQV